MPIADLADWIDDYARPGFIWYVKRLSANDTLATEAHQAGPYVPRAFMLDIFPSLNTTTEKNPDVWFDLYIDSHAAHRRVRAIYYNSKPRGEGTRNEIHITNFGGRQSPVLDPESTGALAVFAFALDETGHATECHVWVCEYETQEELIAERIGPIDPGEKTIWKPDEGRISEISGSAARANCYLTPDEMPSEWLDHFPTGEEIIRQAIGRRTLRSMNPDLRLVRRRQCEFEVFQSLEEAVFLPRILKGFSSISSFLSLAQTVLQSRKSRAGNSLELHVREILIEEGFRNKQDFDHKPVTGDGKRPDFLFPSQAAYDDLSFPTSRLRMLAVKTTCKDRWRQITREADRIATKHLLTLQEGVSEAQFREMVDAGVQLVVPTTLQEAFPAEVRPHLLSLESFIADVRLAAL